MRATIVRRATVLLACAAAVVTACSTESTAPDSTKGAVSASPNAALASGGGGGSGGSHATGLIEGTVVLNALDTTTGGDSTSPAAARTRRMRLASRTLSDSTGDSSGTGSDSTGDSTGTGGGGGAAPIPPIVINVYVLTSSGHSVPGVANGARVRQFAVDTTDATGHFYVSKVPAGQYAFRATPPSNIPYGRGYAGPLTLPSDSSNTAFVQINLPHN